MSDAVRVVLVRPDTAANVGAAARAMRNAGLADLVLVEPGDWRTVEAWRTAWGAHDVLESARVCDRLADALAGCVAAVAFTGRSGADPRLDVRDAAALVARAPGPCALVFGPESAGLTGAEIALCGHAATIPSHPVQPSLNLSHAVMVAVYELYRTAPSGPPVEESWASHEEKQHALAELEPGLRAVGALPAPQARSRMQAWSQLLHRLPLTTGEVHMVQHVARRMVRCRPVRR